ncbi:MAG TPA: prephenate dehydratase domain-containing protein [Clostridia bacterium]|nr:prephenate dehydratase domain-containing protein [Clostridia bacterium]
MILDEAREEIDKIDSQIMKLFSQRMDAVKIVGEIKKSQGLSVLQPERENQLLERIRENAREEYVYYSVALYKFLMDLSRTAQREIYLPDNSFTSTVLRRSNASPLKIEHPNIISQGIPGAFSGSAAAVLYPHGNFTFADSWEDVMVAIDEGSADYGILPLENSLAGSVTDVFDLLLKYQFYIVKATSIPVDHCLLGVRGANLSGISTVLSHPHALLQCENFFHDHPHIRKVPYMNTAMAANKVAKDGRLHQAAIASRECAHIYGLDILSKSIQMNDMNKTRFISVAKDPEFPDNMNKVSLAFSLPHVTGSLYRILARFALNGLNLTKIESRPNPNKNFEYFFYLDFSGSVKSPATLRLLASLSEELSDFHFLGNYHEN